MKLTQELTFFAKRLEKWILSTPLKIGKTNYVRSNGKIFSDLIFQNKLTWDLINQSYLDSKWDDDTTDLINLIEWVTEWKEISLEDINTYDAIWNVAWIDWQDYWIDIKYFQELKKMMAASWHLDFRLRTNNNWLLAFTSRNNTSDEEFEEILIITWLQAIQKSLLDN